MFERILHVLCLLLLPPLLRGVINRTKAWFSGRQGPPLFQPYYDLWKLLQKGSVFSVTTTWIFRVSPVVGLAAIVLAGLLLPLGGGSAPISFAGDLVLFAYLLALARFFMVAAAMDTGSAFEGMGSAREMTFACFAEPVLFFGLLVIAKLAGTLELDTMLAHPLTTAWSEAGGPLLLVLMSWFVVLLVENSRIPFDDPTTHLELTMIHEVMVLDHSGPGFGLILYAAAIKLFIFAALIVRLAVPLEMPPWLNWPAFVASTLLVSVLIGIVESVMARLRMPLVPNTLIGAGVLGFLGLVRVLS